MLLPVWVTGRINNIDKLRLLVHPLISEYSKICLSYGTSFQQGVGWLTMSSEEVALFELIPYIRQSRSENFRMLIICLSDTN